MNQFEIRDEESYLKWIEDAKAFIQVTQSHQCPVDKEDHLIIEYSTNQMMYRCPTSGHQVIIPILQTTNLYTTIQTAEDRMNLILREVESCILSGRRTQLKELQREYRTALTRFQDMQQVFRQLQEWTATIQDKINQHTQAEMIGYFTRQSSFQEIEDPIDPEVRYTLLVILKNEGTPDQRRLAALSKQFKLPVSQLTKIIAWLEACIRYVREQAATHSILHEYRTKTEMIPIYMTRMIQTIPHQEVSKAIKVKPQKGGAEDLDDEETMDIPLDEESLMNSMDASDDDSDSVESVVIDESSRSGSDIKTIHISSDMTYKEDRSGSGPMNYDDDDDTFSEDDDAFSDDDV